MPARPTVDANARSVVDYSLARRTVLHSLAAGRTAEPDVCDAQPYLLRAARYHGEDTGDACPVCARQSLSRVRYTFGDCFRDDVNGRARGVHELAELASRYAEFNVFVVEVCVGCRWNHLLASFVLGRGRAANRRARSRA